MPDLNYHTMIHTTFNWDALSQQQLTEENQDKVIEISHIASILKQYGQPILTTRDFDELYDKSVADLLRITCNLGRAHREMSYHHEHE